MAPSLFSRTTTLENTGLVRPVVVRVMQGGNTTMQKVIQPREATVLYPSIIFRNHRRGNEVSVFVHVEEVEGRRSWTPIEKQIIESNGRIQVGYNRLTHSIEIAPRGGTKFARLRMVAKAKIALNKIKDKIKRRH